jgi:hypothetical protein
MSSSCCRSGICPAGDSRGQNKSSPTTGGFDIQSTPERVTEQVFVQDVVGRTSSDNLAVGHQHDVICESCGKIEIVNDEQNRPSGLRLFLYDVKKTSLVLEIEARRGLVEQKCRGFRLAARRRPPMVATAVLQTAFWAAYARSTG